jgi:hypothetical protein
MAGTATYVYCVVRRDQPLVSGPVPAGVPEASPPTVIEVSKGWWLVSSDVPLTEYAPERIQQRLQDLNWVSRIALGHEAVVERFNRRTNATVIPMKLFTMFSSPERARAELMARRQHLEGVAKRIHGSEEWGVRIVRSRTPPSKARLTPIRERPGAGAAFLAAKKHARDAAREQSKAAIGAAEHALVTLGRLAKHARRHVPPDGATTPPLVDAAFLVPTTRRTRFKQAANREAERCVRAGAELTLTGPWPAYNFVQAEDDDW